MRSLQTEQKDDCTTQYYGDEEMDNFNNEWKNRTGKREHSIKPKFYEDAGLHLCAYYLEWGEWKSEEITIPVNELNWKHADRVPVIGEKRILRAKASFNPDPGETFTALFEPSNIFLHGWESAKNPEEISKVSAVLCRFKDVLWFDGTKAIISAEVLNVVPLAKLYQVVPKNEIDFPFIERFWNGHRVDTDYQDAYMRYRANKPQGKQGQIQLVYTDDNRKQHVILRRFEGSDFFTIENLVRKEKELKPDETLNAIDRLNEDFAAFFRNCSGYAMNNWVVIDYKNVPEIREKESELTLITDREEWIKDAFYDLIGWGGGFGGYQTNVVAEGTEPSSNNYFPEEETIPSFCIPGPGKKDLLSNMINAVLSTLDSINAVMYEVPAEVETEWEPVYGEFLPALIHYIGLEDHWAILSLGWTD